MTWPKIGKKMVILSGGVINPNYPVSKTELDRMLMPRGDGAQQAYEMGLNQQEREELGEIDDYE